MRNRTHEYGVSFFLFLKFCEQTSSLTVSTQVNIHSLLAFKKGIFNTPVPIYSTAYIAVEYIGGGEYVHS